MPLILRKDRPGVTRRWCAWPAGISAAGLAIVLGLGVSGEVPRWRPGGSAVIPHPALAPVLPAPLTLSAGAVIVCEGDSNTAGLRHLPLPAYPQALAERLPMMRVVNRGRGGDTASDGWRHWRPLPGAALVVLMYGTNDAAPRRWLATRRRVSPPDYLKAIAAIARRHREAGAQVLILAPPPSGSSAMDAAIAPFRQAARDAAVQAGVAFRDPAPAFAGLRAPLRYDALHFRPEASLALGDWLAGQIRVASPGPR